MTRRRTGRRFLRALLATLALGCGTAAVGLESDQYFAWGHELDDVTDVLNAKVALEIERALERINSRSSGKRMRCHKVVERIVPHFRQFIFQDIELWATNSSMVDRIPRTAAGEREYRERYIYRNTGFFDLGTKMPPSPTIEVHGVRMGTDKLSHFFSEGLWYFRWYREYRKSGYAAEEAERRVIRRGFWWERTVLGLVASGVFSQGDLEANYEGMRFMVGLCEGERPGLENTDDGWRFVRPFDFRDYVSPEWDESYQPNVYGKRRWKAVRPALVDYCPMLGDPFVVRQRREYAARDRLTPTEQELEALVRTGRIEDPRSFSLDANCPEKGPD